MRREEKSGSITRKGEKKARGKLDSGGPPCRAWWGAQRTGGVKKGQQPFGFLGLTHHRLSLHTRAHTHFALGLEDAPKLVIT